MEERIKEVIKKSKKIESNILLQGYIIVTAVIAILILYIVDQHFLLSYNIKILIKLILFAGIPIGYIKISGDNFIKTSLENRSSIFKMDISKALGIFVVSVIVIAFLAFRQYFDIEIIANDFENKYKIVGNQIIYYGIYLSFINSLLEEFFFRGFIFLGIKNRKNIGLAYVFSSLMFAIYHIANFKNWFNGIIFTLTLIGLFIGGLIFNKLDDKKNTFFNSWFVHICADLAIVVIGYYIIG